MTLALFDPDAPPTGDEPPEDPVPADFRFTAAQAAAIADRERSLLLSANAGSGKTSVLVERFVRAVHDDRVDPTRILAITFTDKAAGELRERVRARFLELGDREAARGTEAAFVSTIHGFCARLLRTHALAAGLDPGFSVLDEARAARTREEAFATALTGLLAGERPDALDLVAAWDPDPLRRAILEAYDELRSQGQTSPRLPAAPPPPELAPLRARLGRTRADCAAELADATDGKMVETARTALERCADLLDTLPADELPTVSALEELRFTCGQTRALACQACEDYLTAHRVYAQACADHRAAGALALLDELLGRFAAAYAEAKRARGALDFDDLELGARDLLADHPELAAAWAERFAVIMVDEFQDTNRRQLALLEALEHDNLFAVGDELQSIYGFRHADVSIFRERRTALAPRGAALALSESFRSRPELLAVLDALFAPRFEPDFVPLIPGRDDAATGEPRVELLVSHANGWEDGDPPLDLGRTLPSAPAGRRAEARLLAQRLRELVDGGEARPGQIAVLVRASGSMPLLERALADVGLPVLASAGRGFWAGPEVAALVAYLTALANPLDEVALATVLGSVGAVSPDGLAVLFRGARETGRDPWWALEAVLVTGEPAEWTAALEPADRAALEAFARWLAAERPRASRLAVDELLERVVAHSRYDVRILALPGGPRRLANVDKLMRLARDFEAAEGRDLRAFVDHAAALERAQRREPEAAVEDAAEEAVRLMTIHAAKGLEFDVVAVADLGRRGNAGVPDLLVDGDRVGLRLRTLDGGSQAALDFEALRERRRAADTAEEQRVLYVALTRARERLILSGTLDPEARPAEGPAAPPLTWLGPALVPDLAERLADATAADAVQDVEVGEGTLRLVLSSPATVGAVLRERFLAPAPAPAAATTPPSAIEVAPADAAPAELGPPAIAAGPLSYTALAGYARCPLRFHAQRVLGLPDVPAPGVPGPRPSGPRALDARSLGVLVHALLERLDLRSGRLPDAELVAELAAAEGVRATPGDVAGLQRLAGAFAGSALRERLAAARHARREHEFAFELESGRGPLLTGAVDLLGIEEDGTWLIVDAKTDHLAPGDDPAAAVARDYAIQRDLYALAALRAGAPVVEVAHLYLERPEAPVTARFTAADEPRLAAALHALSDRIAAGDFAPTDRPHAGLCATCPARGTRCPHPRELTLRLEPV